MWFLFLRGWGFFFFFALLIVCNIKLIGMVLFFLWSNVLKVGLY